MTKHPKALDEPIELIEINRGWYKEALAKTGITGEKQLALLAAIIQEAKWRGAVELGTWVMRNDQSSFRQEKAWYKIHPGLFLCYQAALVAALAEAQEKVKRLQDGQMEEADKDMYQEIINPQTRILKTSLEMIVKGTDWENFDISHDQVRTLDRHMSAIGLSII